MCSVYKPLQHVSGHGGVQYTGKPLVGEYTCPHSSSSNPPHTWFSDSISSSVPREFPSNGFANPLTAETIITQIYKTSAAVLASLLFFFIIIIIKSPHCVIYMPLYTIPSMLSIPFINKFYPFHYLRVRGTVYEQ